MKTLDTEARLQVKKFIKAKREKVFEAWTKPEMMKKWYAPGEMTVANASSDLRVGGTFQVAMQGIGSEMVNPIVSGKYTKIIPNELLVFTWKWQGHSSPESIVTVEFKDVNGGTEVTLTHDRLASKESRDKHEHGWKGCLDNLAKRISQ